MRPLTQPWLPCAAQALAAAVVSLACTAPAMALDYVSEVWASGLNSPRGMSFGPDGALWVTEAGVPGGDGPSTVIRGVTLTYNTSASITRIFGSEQARVIGGLPSLYSTGGQMEAGPTDIGFDASGNLSVLIGLGMNPALRGSDLAPVGYQFGRLVSLGSAIDIAAHEAAFNPAGGPLDSNPWRFSQLADGSRLVTDAGANALLRVAADGGISTVATFGPRDLGGPFPTDSVPTGLAIGPDGAAYVGELTGFPFVPGSARIHRIGEDGAQSIFATDFTMVIDIGFDAAGHLFVLEYDSDGLLAPGSEGRLWQLAADGSRSLVWSDGLVQPTGLAIGADGAFYIGNNGNGVGLGEVLRISAVPEASTQVLLMLGLGVVAFIARRRRAN